MPELDQLLGQEAHRPPRPARRRVRAGQGYEVGLHLAVELAGRAGDLRRAESGFEPILDEPLADPLDGADADLALLADLFVGRVLGDIGLEQDPRVFQGPGQVFPRETIARRACRSSSVKVTRYCLFIPLDSFPRSIPQARVCQLNPTNTT